MMDVRDIPPSGTPMVDTDCSTPSKRVEGTPVYNRNGKRLGTIDHLMFDKNSGRYYAVLRFSTLLGISERYYPVPWTTLAYDARLGGYVADIDLSRLQKAPSYSNSSLPELSNFRTVDDYWGASR
jgi:hypothetical protein